MRPTLMEHFMGGYGCWCHFGDETLKAGGNMYNEFRVVPTRGHPTGGGPLPLKKSKKSHIPRGISSGKVPPKPPKSHSKNS